MRWVFDGFEIDEDGPRLLRGGREVPLERRTADLLCYFAEHPGRLIRKGELLERVWNAHAMSDGALSNTVAKLRKALGQGGRARVPIETVHGRGYRFHAIGKRSAPSPAPVATGHPAAEPFIGRRGVLSVLDESLERAAHGGGGVLIVTGEAAIGKSRTLEELATRARSRGFTTWAGAAYAGGAAPAYWPWVEIARSALVDATVRSCVPRDCWALPALVPELLAPAPKREAALASRFQLFDELTRWFAGAAALAPRLIVIEDLHWSDLASVELLSHLVHALERKPVLFAISVRDYEVHPEDGRAGALQRLMRAAVHVALRGLEPPDVSELVYALGGVTLDEQTLRALYDLTQGNPFFVRQVVHLLRQHGSPFQASSFEAAERPAAMRGVLQQRLAAVPTESRLLLRAASVIGRTFDAQVLARLLARDLTTVLPALEPALHSGIVRAQASPLLRFEFNHALLQETLYEELGLVERGGLHAGMLHALGEVAAADGGARRLAEIARHSLAAVPFAPEACALHCRQAARAARDAAGYEAAAEFLSLALEKLAADGSAGALRCELLYDLGLDQFCAGDILAGIRTLTEGANLARRIGAVCWLARLVCRVSSWRAVTANDSGLASLVDDALARLPETELAMRAELLARRAELGHYLDRTTRSEIFDEAQRIAAAVEGPEVLLNVASARVSQRDPSRVEECRTAVAAYRAIEARLPQVFDAVRHRLRRVNAELTEYWAALIVGDLASAEIAATQCEAAAAVFRVPQLTSLVALIRVGRALGDGRLDDASVCIERLREHAKLAGGLGASSMLSSFLLLEARDDPNIVEVMARTGDLSVLDALSPEQSTASLAWVAALVARRGHTELARSILERLAPGVVHDMPARYADLGVLCSLAEAYSALGDLANVAELYARLAPYAAYNAVGITFEYRGSVAHYLGTLALALDRPQLAVEHLQQALEFNTRLGMQLQVPRTRELLAQARATLPTT